MLEILTAGHDRQLGIDSGCRSEQETVRSFGEVIENQSVSAALVFRAGRALVADSAAKAKNVVAVVAEGFSEQADGVVLRRVAVARNNRRFTLQMIAADRRAGRVDFDALQLTDERNRVHRRHAAWKREQTRSV